MPKSQFIDPGFLRKPGRITFSDIPVNVYMGTVAEEREHYSDEDFLRIYRDMAILREFESMLHSVKTQGSYNGVETAYPGPAHLSLGQEAAAVGQACLLGRDDPTFGSHRSHGEILAKGLSCIEKFPDGELMKIMREFLGGETLRIVESNMRAGDARELARHFLLYGTDPVVFFESQLLYDIGEQFREGGVSREPYEIEPGDVNRMRPGRDPHRRRGPLPRGGGGRHPGRKIRPLGRDHQPPFAGAAPVRGAGRERAQDRACGAGIRRLHPRLLPKRRRPQPHRARVRLPRRAALRVRRRLLPPGKLDPRLHPREDPAAAGACPVGERLHAGRADAQGEAGI